MKYCDKRLSEYEDITITDIGFIEDNDDISIEVIIDGFNILFSKTKRSVNKKFKKLFRRKNHRILPYFKIVVFDYNKKEVVGLCRISMYEPKYLTGYGENMILNKDQVNKLINLLNGHRSIRYNVDDVDHDLTNWEYGIFAMNRDFKMSGIKYHIPNNLKIPDYIKLLEENAND